MAASWPSAKKTFSQIVNGVTKLVALIFNVGYDEIEAIETFIGASGNAQSKLAALNRLFKYLLPTISITWIDADTIEIAACGIMMHSGSNYVIKENTSALQIKLSVNLDTGSEASSTWYYVYLCGDGASSTYTAVFSASASAPTGYTYYKLIGKIYNNSSSDLVRATIQVLPLKAFGAWDTTTYSNNTAYLAATDGFVVATPTDAQGGTLQILSDVANPPTTEVMHGVWNMSSGSQHFGQLIPIRKGDYWKTTGANTVAWLPFGS